MESVSYVTMTPDHVTTARSLLNLSANDLAKQLPFDLDTLIAFENGDEIDPSSRAAIFEILIAKGVQMQIGDGPNVRVKETGKWKIKIIQSTCPECDAKMPKIRKPKNMRQFLWGGWTCQNCGTEISKSGQKLWNEK